jgi:hypothetical protein
MRYARGAQLANVLPLKAAIPPAGEARRGEAGTHREPLCSP